MIKTLTLILLLAITSSAQSLVNLSGRVTYNGQGVSKAVITVAAATGINARTVTNPLGYYQLQVWTGFDYVVAAQHKMCVVPQVVIVFVDGDKVVNFEFEGRN